MPMTLFPRYQEWLLLTATIQNRRADSVMKYLDSLIQTIERSGVSYNYYLTICDLFFTTDYWLKANPRYSPAHASVEDLYRLAVKRLCEIFKCTVNVLPRELELMFGRGMTSEGFKTDIIQGRSRTATQEDVRKYRAVFKQGKVWQFPHWEAHPTELLKPVDSASLYDPKAGLKRKEGDNFYQGYAYFVMTMGRDLFLRQHSIGGVQEHNGIYHSNYTGGGAVLCAGSMLIEGGVVKVVRSDSGHYKPQEGNMVSLLLALQMHGIDIRNIQVVNFSATQVVSAPKFIEANGDWTNFITDREYAPLNNGYAYAYLQSSLQEADKEVGKIAPEIPRVQGHGNYTGKYIGNNPNLPPNLPKPPQAPPRPPRPGMVQPQAPQGHMRMVNGVMRSGRQLPQLPGQQGSGRKLPPLPGQRSGFSSPVAPKVRVGDEDLYQTK